MNCIQNSVSRPLTLPLRNRCKSYNGCVTSLYLLSHDLPLYTACWPCKTSGQQDKLPRSLEKRSITATDITIFTRNQWTAEFYISSGFFKPIIISHQPFFRSRPFFNRNILSHRSIQSWAQREQQHLLIIFFLSS